MMNNVIDIFLIFTIAYFPRRHNNVVQYWSSPLVRIVMLSMIFACLLYRQSTAVLLAILYVTFNSTKKYDAPLEKKKEDIRVQCKTNPENPRCQKYRALLKELRDLI
jgi:hypothetical protein